MDQKTPTDATQPQEQPQLTNEQLAFKVNLDQALVRLRYSFIELKMSKYEAIKKMITDGVENSEEWLNKAREELKKISNEIIDIRTD